MSEPLAFTPPRSAAADWSLIAIPGVIWGASFLLIAEGLEAMGPMGVTLMRIVIGFAALACFRQAWRPIDREDWPMIGWLGLLWLAFPMSMFPFAEQRISSALAGMLNGAVPLTATIIAAVIARRLPGRGVLAGLAVGLVGVVLMAIPDLGNPSSAAGVLMVAVACVSYGFAPNIARPLQQKYGALPVIWRAQGVALLMTLPFGARDVWQATWSPIPILSLLALGALGTGVAHVVMTTASGRLGASKASASAFLIPPVALLLGVLVRSEHVAILAVIGGIACVAGAWLMRRSPSTVPSTRIPAPVAKAAAILVVAGVIGALPTALDAQERVLPLPRLTGAIKVDGRSDDQAWQSVVPLPVAVHLPAYRSAPTERTIVRVAYDDDALYVVIDALEAHAGGVRASTMLRDDDGPGDFINVLLDTFGDRQNAVNFSTTPGGQRNDWAISNDAQSTANFSPAWNAVWELTTRRDDAGWYAEYRIPFSTLRFNATDGRVEFGLSVNRLTAHSNERQTFPDIEPSAPLALWKPSRWQRVSVEGIATARSVRLTPFVIAGLQGARTPDPGVSPWTREEVRDAGADLKVALTPSVTLDLTANTDFAETEADDQRVNLTRYPLLFPERRPFFVERAGMFEVRTADTDFLFNSRRVGLSATGEPVRLLGGARIVGRVRGWDIGMFDAQTARGAGGSRENLGVLRVRHGVWNERSWLGLMATSRVAGDSDQVALGADGDIYLGGDDYISFGAAMLAGDAGTGVHDGVLPRGAMRLVVERRRDRDLWYRAGVSTIGAQFAPALGYVERGDAIRPRAELGYGRVVSQSGRVLRTSVVGAGAWRNASGTFDASLGDLIIGLQQPSGATWTLTASRQEDDLLLPFAPTPGTTVPAGRHQATFAQVAYTASTGPRAVVGGSVRAGEYYDGRLVSFVFAPEWRVSAHLRMSGEVQVHRISFASRDEREWSRLARLRVQAAASPRLTLSALLQTNSLANRASANVRVRYNVGEGNDLWVVYGQQEHLDRDRATPALPGTAAAGLLVKLTRSFGR